MTARLHTPEELCQALGVAFSDQQLAAITAPLAPGVIIAGAGSGKTTVMAARVVWLVGTGQVAPEQVLGLTFTRKAASELSARVRAALDVAGVLDPHGVDDAGEQLILTYDAFAARLVSEHGVRIGAESDPVMITGASRFRLASRVVASAAGPFENLSRLRPDSITQRVLDLDAEMTAHLVSLADIDRHAREFLAEVAQAPLNRQRAIYASLKGARAAAEERLELAGLAGSYADLKRSLGYVEFADQMAVAARLAQRIPAVSAALRQRFAVVLLDEYQDTSSAQAALLRGLFSGTDRDDGLGHPVTAVGDPCQAIYGWRGAAASNIVSFAEEFRQASGAPAERFALTVNRRSGPAILTAANALAANLRADPAMAFEGRQLTLVAPEGTPAGVVEVGSFETWDQEVGFIADQIAEAEAVGSVDRWSEIAVLTRRNAQIGTLYAALTSRNIPVEIVGLGGLLDLPEIVEVTSMLSLLDDGDPNPSLIRVLTGPRWAVGRGDLVLLGRRALALAGGGSQHGSELGDDLDRALADTDASVTVSLVEALEDPGDLPYSDQGRERFGRLATELRVLRRHAAEPVIDLVGRVIAHLGLDLELASQGAGSQQLGAFSDAVARYVDVDGEASLAGLLGYLDAERDHGVGLDQAVVSEANSVKLLTVHKAKGLEWDLVFVPGLAADVFPNLRVTSNWLKSAQTLPAELRGDSASVPQLAEVTDAAASSYAKELTEQAQFAEDRLAYVAVTRARRRLVATTHTWEAGLVKPRQPSAYFAALTDLADVVAVAPPVAGTNPNRGGQASWAWPDLGDPAARDRRSAVAVAVSQARQELRDGIDLVSAEGGETLDEAATVAGWDQAFDRLVTEATRPVHRPAPGYLSATALVRASREPAAFAAELDRPMPRLLGRGQRQGTRFHRWLEERFQLEPSFDLEPDAVDETALAEFAELSAAFERGQFATRRPAAVEVPFSMMLGSLLVRGRIDAVFRTDDGWLVVDWKTGRAALSDPTQLAVYRVAWAELNSVPPDNVRAAFFDIRADRLIEPQGLAGRAELEELVRGVTALPRVAR